MKTLLLSWIRKILSDTHNVAVGAILVVVFGGGSFATLAFPNTVQEMLTSIPQIWLLIAMSLGSLLISLIVIRQTQTKKKTAQRKWGTLIKAGGLKWLVSHSSGLVVHIKEIPYCPKHERQLIQKNDIIFCPKEKCTFEVSIQDINNAFPSIESEIEKVVREL